uniref:Uncharacterized protein n=1 Tax=Loxodonta africana TaxID=9785 RepID=G3U1H7_LOXAF
PWGRDAWGREEVGACLRAALGEKCGCVPCAPLGDRSFLNFYCALNRSCPHSFMCLLDPGSSLLTSIIFYPIVQSNPCLKSWLWEW